MNRAQRFVVTPCSTAVAVAVAALSQGVAAQEERKSATAALLEEIVVTARKTEESLQSVPVAVSAYNAEQIDALKIRSIHDLSVGMPGVMLEDVGTQRGTANFSSRGVGMRGSIPSFDPAVGVFIDGIYLGLNNGIMMDAFDLESIEVLRGPQGTLFGRNTTGGAVLVNTRDPSEEFEVRVRVAADGNPNGDGGLNSYVQGSVTGALTDTLSAKLVAYYNNDDGWFENRLTGDDAGASESTMFRGALRWMPTDRVDVTVRYEYQDIEADGAVAQSHTSGRGVPGTPQNFKRDTFDLSIDETGYDNSDLDFVTAEVNYDVDFGEGTITWLAGWRDYQAEVLADIDSQPVWMFHGITGIDYTQYSNELRYSGNFDRLSVTTGLMQFSNELKYGEGRLLLGVATGGVAPALTQHGGGEQDTDSYAWFGSADYDLTDQWTLNAGLNVTYEKKDAKVATLIFNVNSPCDVLAGECPFDFDDDKDWTNVAPKLGATYQQSDNTLLYGHWARAYRSGLYNLRNSNADTVNFGPGPTDEEEVDSFEVGIKHDLAIGGRINAALYYSSLEDAQRSVLVADPNAGVGQTFRNAGDINIFGAEVDAQFPLTDNLLLSASAGYIDAEWDNVGDLNGDGVADGEDKSLNITSVPEWTYALGLMHEMPIGSWILSSRINYSFRDKIYTTDDNLGFVDSLDILNAGLDFGSADGQWVLSLYGRNLLNEVNFGGDTQLPARLGPVPLGGTFAPLQKGRQVGVQVEYNF